jgi:vacuolar-type H+-ATPase subunit E/Vma4
MNLAPLRSALLSAAQAEADSSALATATEAAAELSLAEAQVASVLAGARAEAEDAAGREARRIVGRARSDARRIALRARRDVYDELCVRVKAAALELRHDPTYDRLLERLQAIARAQLGEDATLDVDPPGVGGVRGVSGSRHIDLTLSALAERSLASLGPELELLWR